MKHLLGLSFATALAFTALGPMPANAFCLFGIFGDCGFPHGPPDPGPGPIHGAPGPIAGAGLPFAAIGYGAYWLYKRRRKAG